MASEDNLKARKLFTEYLNEISSDQGSEEFLREEGIDTNQLLNEGLRKIKQIQMNITAEKTEQEYQAMKSSLYQKAKDQVEKLLSDASFSLQSFIKEESINVAYRNFEDMTKEEIREFLERHFLLKFNKDNGKTSD